METLFGWTILGLLRIQLDLSCFHWWQTGWSPSACLDQGSKKPQGRFDSVISLLIHIRLGREGRSDSATSWSAWSPDWWWQQGDWWPGKHLYLVHWVCNKIIIRFYGTKENKHTITVMVEVIENKTQSSKDQFNIFRKDKFRITCQRRTCIQLRPNCQAYHLKWQQSVSHVCLHRNMFMFRG